MKADELAILIRRVHPPEVIHFQLRHAPPSCLFGCVMIFSDNASSLRLPSSSLQPHFRTSHPLPSPPTSHRPNQTSVSAPTSPFARSRLCAFPTLALLCLVQRSDVPQLALPYVPTVLPPR